MKNNDMLDKWNDDKNNDRERIKNAYKSVQGSFNTNSMTLFSGEIEGHFEQFIAKRYRLNYCCNWGRKSGCLFTGDYEAAGNKKWSTLKDAYKVYWNEIGCVQIPHHGSKYSFNNGLLDIDAFFIISAGYANKYQHPHAKVLNEMLKNGYFPYIVTEKVGSSVFLLIK